MPGIDTEMGNVIAILTPNPFVRQTINLELKMFIKSPNEHFHFTRIYIKLFFPRIPKIINLNVESNGWDDFRRVYFRVCKNEI